MNPAIKITTQRLTLREYQETDFPGVHTYSKDSETLQFMTWGPNQPKDTRAFIQAAIEEQRYVPRKNYYFIVVLKLKHKVIGGCGLNLLESQRHTAAIGYIFNKAYWGQGFASEAAQALLKLGFSHLGLHRIVATCDTRNLASAGVLEKNHMRREAHFRKHLWQKGEWRDSYLYAILADEWQSRTDSIAILTG